MTLPGGPAAKLGHRYERWWTLSELVRMLRDKTESLRLEPPGEDDVEFIVKAGGTQEYHQAKRSHPSGKWSVATLASAGVLASMGKRLIGNCHRFVFVSGSDARELADLCEGAADAESFEEFGERFLRAKQRASSYKKVLNKWDCDGRDAWDVLRRIDVRTTSEHELATKVDYGLSALFLGNADDLRTYLATIVDNAVHRTIERTALLGQLEQAGFLLRKVSNRHTARQAVVDATDRYLRGVRRNLIQGSLIPRDKTDEIVARLTGEQPADCVLTGKAGTGKTGCVLEVVEKLRERGTQVLAFRLDRYMLASSAPDLGQRLELEESPALALSAAAKLDGAPAVLIVDQLDAVSAMSGWDSQAFDVVGRLLTEAKAARIGTVVVCRTFDWHNDPHLRTLIRDDDREVNLNELSLDELQGVLAKVEVDADAFSTPQLNLLRLPQNLSLFLNANFSSPMAFSSVSDLLGRYWNEKRRLVGGRAERESDQWLNVIDTMCGAIGKTQHLSVPEHKLDSFSPSYLDQFVSEDVLAKDGASYAFGHESFFDYCFARLFANKKASLTTELKSSEQHLFRRSQVRQVLVYLREADFARYVKELEALVAHEDIRVHIKDLVFALLASVDDPYDKEWDIWMAYVEPQLPAIEQRACEDRLTMCAWQRIFYAWSWFKQFDERGMIAGWLKAGCPSADLAIEYLSRQQRDWPDRVAEHLEPYVDQHGEWALRLQNVLSKSDYGVSRRQFDLFLRLLERGVFDLASDSRSGGGVWQVLWKLGERRPEWVPEVVAHVLFLCGRQLQGNVAGPTKASRDSVDAGSASEAIDKAAKRHPRLFVHHVLPAVLDMAEAAPKIGSGPPVRDAVWPILIKGAYYSFTDSCLVALTDSLANLARFDEGLRDEIEVLVGKQTYVANHLLLAVYRGGGHRYADEAAMEFCSNPWRFHCGYSDSLNWCATETLKAVVPHCKPASRTELEKVVLAYVDPYEKGRTGVRHRGWAAFNLLTAIPAELRSDRAKRRVEELQRKFNIPAAAPKGVVGGIVGSPIAPERADKMTDDDWRGAIATYRSNTRGGATFKDGRFIGAAWELSSVFGKKAKEEPERFARLGLDLPRETNPVYFSALLRGLAETALDEDEKVVVCRRVFECARVECGHDIADLLAKASAPLSEDALDMLVWLATKAEDMEDEEQWNKDSGNGQFYFNGDIDTNGINTTRGRAALAIGGLILKDGTYVPRLEAVLGELVRVRSASVASCVAYALRTVAYHDVALGIDLFLRMDFSEERLLGTRHVREFMHENLHHEFHRMKGLIVRMAGCPYPDVSRAGAGLGCMAALFNDDAEELAEESQHGNRHQRLGSADVASVNVGEPEYRQWCEDALRVFFVDDDLEIRKVAASCFRHIPDRDLATYEGLIEAFCNSPACEDNAFPLLDALKRARAALPGMTHLVCERLLDHAEGHGFDIWGVSELAFRLYQQHPNDEWTGPALDLIDRLCLEAPVEAAHGLQDFER